MANSTLRVLLAEDNEVNQHLVSRILSRAGVEPVLARTGIQVLNKMDRQDFDLVLMDIQMPEMDGVTAVKLIRAHYPPEKQPRIVALTAETSLEERERYLAAGMDSVLTKPIQIDALLQVIAELQHPSTGSHELPLTPKRAPGLNEYPVLEPAVINEFVTLMADEGGEAARHLIDLYHQGTPDLIASLQIAADERNTAEVLRLLHTLKGSSSQVGAQRMEQLCTRLEVLVKQSGLEPFMLFLPGISQEYVEVDAALNAYILGLT